MNLLFERLALQAHFRRVFDQVGTETGWQLIQAAVEKESVNHLTQLPVDDQEAATCYEQQQ